MLLLAGTVAFAEMLGLIDTGPVARSLLAGLAFGAVAGRLVVVWRERGGNELPPERVRQVEASWTMAGTAVSLLLLALS
ncbi:MAG TPA: hypothetical protein VFY48_11440 [Solirubrobacterales bacterium]|nr:hypothetical protein [Solirubrobacterales bacterium]